MTMDVFADTTEMDGDELIIGDIDTLTILGPWCYKDIMKGIELFSKFSKFSLIIDNPRY